MLWEFDTNREFTTVNGVPAKGASINGAGPVIAGGMVYVNSGYGALGGRPGNVLLAFGVDASTSAGAGRALPAIRRPARRTATRVSRASGISRR